MKKVNNYQMGKIADTMAKKFGEITKKMKTVLFWSFWLWKPI